MVRTGDQYKQKGKEYMEKAEGWMPNIAGFPRPPMNWEQAGTFRRVDCGFVNAEVGLGTAEDVFRGITII